jgi:crossover junction endodeoxyribonuclease RuvC
VPVRVLGVDPGLTRCGVGVVEGLPGRPCKLIHYEVVTSEPGMDLALRLLNLDERLTALVGEFRPESVAVERVFSQHNVRTVMGTAQVAGLAILAATRAGVPIALHTPSEVKAAVTGSGRADKAPRPADAADALALAICHLWRGAAQARLVAAVART